METIPSIPTTIGITITIMSNSFFSSLARVKYLSIFSPTFTFTFTLWSTRTANLLNKFFFYTSFHTRSDLLFRIGCLFVSQSSREFYAFHFQGQILFCSYSIVEFKSLAQFSVDHLFHWILFSPSFLLYHFAVFTHTSHLCLYIT